MGLDQNNEHTANQNFEESQVFIEFLHENKDILNQKDLNVLSLFSGCGGMDLGFEGHFQVFKKSINEIINPEYIDSYVNDNEVMLSETRFQTVFANDILSDARNAWVNYFGKKGYSPNIFHTESIVDLVKTHQSGINVFPQQVDVVTGGFPCQDFSIAGKRRGLDSHKDHNGLLRENGKPSEETRGKLYMWMKQVIEITKPKVFIAENVKGLVNLSDIKSIIQKDFSSASDDGYFVFDPQVLHSADYGVPQSRERVIFIGIKKSEINKEILDKLLSGDITADINPYPKATHRYTNRDEQLKPFVSVNDVVGNLPEPDQSSDPTHQYYSKAKFMGKHCQGQIEVKLNGIAPTIRAEHHGNIEYRRLSEANGGTYTDEIRNGLLERRLSPRECALLQTFPKDYNFVVRKNDKSRNFIVSPSKAYKIIGNAVPPLLAYHIAKRLEYIWPLYFNK